MPIQDKPPVIESTIKNVQAWIKPPNIESMQHNQDHVSCQLIIKIPLKYGSNSFVFDKVHACNIIKLWNMQERTIYMKTKYAMLMHKYKEYAA